MREEAKRRAELYQALADGKKLQVRFIKKSNIEESEWKNLDDEDSFELLKCETIHYEKVRVKPEPKKGWYRVAMFRKGDLQIATARDQYPSEKAFSENRTFVRWLTDRIEYELPEGEA